MILNFVSDCGSYPYSTQCPLLSIEIPELTTNVIFPESVPVQTPPRDDYNFTDLDYMTQQQLLDICGQDIITFSEMGAPEKEVLWEKRYVNKVIRVNYNIRFSRFGRGIY